MKNNLRKLVPIAILLAISLSSCYTSRMARIADVKTGGIDSADIGHRAAPRELIKGNETFVSYSKSDSVVIDPSNVIDFEVTQVIQEKIHKHKEKKAKREKRKREKAARESHRAKRERRKREKAEWKANHPHEKLSCREKHKRAKAERKAAKEKIKAARPAHESCHQKRIRHKKEKAERRERRHEKSPRARHKREKHHKVKGEKKPHGAYAYAEINKYYYRYLPMNGFNDFFIAMFAILYPPSFAHMPPVHEKKVLTGETCYGINGCNQLHYSRKILLETSINCRRDKINGPVTIWEDLPKEITMNSYKVKIRGGRRQVKSVNHSAEYKDGKLYHNFDIIPRKGSFGKHAKVWIIMDVSVNPVANFSEPLK